MSRNEPCPCGSGKKYKKCCLPKEAAPARFSMPLMPFRNGERVFVQTIDSAPQPEDYVTLLDLGVAYKRRGLYEQAKEQCIKAIKVNPKHYQAYYNLGKVLYILGEYAQAVKSYKTALELGYDRVGDVMRHMGHCLLDEKAESADKHIVKHYLQSIDPYKSLDYKKPTTKQVDTYDATCAAAARRYVEAQLAEK